MRNFVQGCLIAFGLMLAIPFEFQNLFVDAGVRLLGLGMVFWGICLEPSNTYHYHPYSNPRPLTVPIGR